MAKILGLDLGTNSIGWALIDDNNNQILGSGVRIFPEGVDNLGQGEREKSKNASRREARQMRRQYFRKRLRKIKLLELLIQYKMCPLTVDELKQWKFYDKKKGKAGKKFPASEQFCKWIALNPYKLRAEAVDNNRKLNLEEFGRILYHMIHLRGFFSNRKSKEDGKMAKGEGDIVGFTETSEQLKKYPTYGHFMYSIIPKDKENYKRKLDENNNKEIRARARYTLRKWYVNEFEAIWKEQATHLGLDKIEFLHKKTKTTGNPFSKGKKQNGIKNRLQKKIDYLNNTGRKTELFIDEHEPKNSKLIIQKNIPIKELLGGGSIMKQEESILFYQRPLRSQKGLLNQCTFEKTVKDENGNKIYFGKKTCPISHHYAELRRAYEFINTIEYESSTRLNDTQRAKVLELINSSDKNFDFSEIPKKLNLTYEKFNYENKHKVAGNYTIKHLKPLFSDELWNKEYENIWHCFYFYSDSEKLVEKLKKDFSLKEKDADKVIGKEQEDGTRKGGIILKDGYTNLSLKAISNLLPYLEKGYKYNEAVLLGGVRNAFGKRWSYFESSHGEIEKSVISINRQKDNKEGESIEKIKEYLVINNYGFETNDKAFYGLYHHSQETYQAELNDELGEAKNLRNPIVQQTISELRKLVSEIKNSYKEYLREGKYFDQINVELVRELKQSRQKRIDQWYVNLDREKENKEALQMLDDFGLAQTRDNLHKYLLWKELQNENGIACCPYTGLTISPSDLFGQANKFQIEHIIPYSRSLDDSFSNKTLCESKENGEKGERTPFEFYGNNDKNWELIKERAFRVLPYNKAKRFTSHDKHTLEGFISRQLNDTRYISKEAKNYLSEICKDVKVFPGQLTAKLRHLWGLDEILSPPFIVSDDEKPGRVWAKVDKQGKVIAYFPVFNKKPKNEKGVFIITGEIKDSEFSSKYLTLSYPAENLENGKYWAKIKVSELPYKLVKIFIDKPGESKDESIFILGKVKPGKEEKSIFTSVFLPHKIDGPEIPNKIPEKDEKEIPYWAKLSVVSDKLKFFNIKEKDKIPEAKKGSILIYGIVKDNIFTSKIYSCSANIEDGKYHALVQVDLASPVFYKAKNDEPEKESDAVIVTGIVYQKHFFPNIDRNHPINTETEQNGLHWAEFELKTSPYEFQSIQNPKPEYDKNTEQLIEGGITEIEELVDIDTGEIITEAKKKVFYPAKNRGDQRHHAVDAIVVAMTKQGYLQKLSTYSANKKAKNMAKEFTKEELFFPPPWVKFRDNVENSANRILVSYKKQNKVLTTKNTHSIKDNKKFKGIGVKGQLHDKTYYGKRWDDPSKTISSYRVRKSLSDLSPSMVRDIADNKIKKMIYEEITNAGFKLDENKKPVVKGKEQEKKFKALLSKPIFLENKKGGEPVPIKKIRIKVEIGNAEHLKQNTKIFHLKRNIEGDLNQYVEPGNNHHVLIFKDASGNLREDIVTFWNAVERKKQKQEVVQLPPKYRDGIIVATLRENDMYLLDIDGKLNEISIDWKNVDYIFLSKYLYRLEAKSSKYYEFRHHLEANQDREYAPYYYIISSLGKGIKGWETFNPIPVQISPTGKLQKKTNHAKSHPFL
jgi:CRISPR-associated endonuclease Csn1